MRNQKDLLQIGIGLCLVAGLPKSHNQSLIPFIGDSQFGMMYESSWRFWIHNAKVALFKDVTAIVIFTEGRNFFPHRKALV